MSSYRRGSNSSRGSSSRGGRGSGGGRAPARRGNKRGGSRGGSGGGDKDFAFLKLGDITVSKKTQDELGEGIITDLQDMNANLWVKIYLPENADSITIRHDDRLLISLRPPHEKAPDFLVGSLMLPNDED